jgi:hypothetical protein
MVSGGRVTGPERCGCVAACEEQRRSWDEGGSGGVRGKEARLGAWGDGNVEHLPEAFERADTAEPVRQNQYP